MLKQRMLPFLIIPPPPKSNPTLSRKNISSPPLFPNYRKSIPPPALCNGGGGGELNYGGRKWLVDFSARKTELVLFDCSNNTGGIEVKMDGTVLDEKPCFKILGLSSCSKLEWGSYNIYIAKTASKKIGTLICSMKFLSPEVALYLYRSTIQPCMEYCCHIWAGALSCYLQLLNKLQKLIFRTVGPPLATSLEPLAHCGNIACLF